MGDPAQLARFRVIIESTEADQKVMRSQIIGPDGEWFDFSRAEYSRTGLATPQGSSKARSP